MSKHKKKSSAAKAAAVKKSKFRWQALIPFVLLAAVFAYLIISGRLSLNPGESAPESAAESSAGAESAQESAESLNPEVIFPFNLGDKIELQSIGSYAGFYVEDGSDELVSAVPVITLENKGSKAVVLMSLELTDAEGRVYEFELTTLMPGARIAVLEKNRAEYRFASQIVSVRVTRYSVFPEVPVLPTDVLQLMSQGGKITVKNISDQTVRNGHLYYKNLSGELLIGGITYSVTIPELAPGESAVLSPAHYTDGSSRILFINYGS